MPASPVRQSVDRSKFRADVDLPFNLRPGDFELAMQDVYDFLHDVNTLLLGRNLPRLDDILRPAAMSGMFSDLLSSSLGKHSRSLVDNRHFNGHPDLIVSGVYPNNATASGSADNGVEVKSTRKRGAAVDTHGARDQWLCVFVYEVDAVTEPAAARTPTRFREVYIQRVAAADFRRNARGELGTRTATLHAEGLKKLRSNCVYLD